MNKADLARYYREYSPVVFSDDIVPPSEDYLQGRDVHIPVSAELLIRFYGEKTRQIRDIMMNLARMEP